MAFQMILCQDMPDGLKKVEDSPNDSTPLKGATGIHLINISGGDIGGMYSTNRQAQIGNLRELY
ncbi:hypothetical protein N7466_002003 [Penicillium verhagenii]|uniref:uncharacterized protein n=1 Tax=Penicillium verhagenii TaxID=1562060 RepID=UPI0025453C1B|nr:uncharacterized protein N7466_002003 [Penicillium verhagenii]KAJ5938869.1 hypothetical protein N7466_002003 [Penicillium verhagenii]